MMNNASQNTGDENNICSMPTKTAASGIDGQKLLYVKYEMIKMEYVNGMRMNEPRAPLIVRNDQNSLYV